MHHTSAVHIEIELMHMFLLENAQDIRVLEGIVKLVF